MKAFACGAAGRLAWRTAPRLAEAPQPRPGVLSDRALEVMLCAFVGVCGDFNAVLKEANGEDDHVHLLLDGPAHKVRELRFFS